MRFERPPFQNRNVPRDDNRNMSRGDNRHMPRDDSRNMPRQDSEQEPAGESREAEYLQHLADEKTQVAIHLRTGETFRGFIEYYDKAFVRLTMPGGPNLFIFKHDIKYLSEE